LINIPKRDYEIRNDEYIASLPKSFGNFLRTVKHKNKMTVDQIIEASTVGRNTISETMRGARLPSFENAQKIVFGVGSNWSEYQEYLDGK